MAGEIAFANGQISNFEELVSHDLNLVSGHTAYLRASLIDLYPHAKFHWNRKNFRGRMNGHTYARTYGHLRTALLGQHCRRANLIWGWFGVV